MWRLGGSHAVRNWARGRLDTRRRAGIAAWVLGIVLFFDDYANTAVVGSTMTDISDHLEMSREKLSHLVDSTAAPVATLAISSWVAFQLPMIGPGYESTFTGADLIDHVRTQFYYAATVILVVAALMLVWGYTRITPYALLAVGVLALVALVYGLSEFDAGRRGIDPRTETDRPDGVTPED